MHLAFEAKKHEFQPPTIRCFLRLMIERERNRASQYSPIRFFCIIAQEFKPNLTAGQII